MYTKATSPSVLYIRNIIPDNMSIPLLGYLALSGWGYTDFHASMNFAFIEFYEVRGLGILGSSAKWSPQKAAKKIVKNTAIE
jgi:hypothetical protein